MSKPIIRTFLDLSTAHLPEWLRDVLPDEHHPESWGGATVEVLENGFWLWVPDDPKDSAEGSEEGIPETILKIQLYARAHGCDYVLFDSDGETNDDLPAFED